MSEWVPALVGIEWDRACGGLVLVLLLVDVCVCGDDERRKAWIRWKSSNTPKVGFLLYGRYLALWSEMLGRPEATVMCWTP